MKSEIITTPTFCDAAKKLMKRYPNLANDLKELGKQLMKNPTAGTKLDDANDQFRVAVKDRGKMHGVNIITKVVFKVQKTNKKEALVYLADIYDKVDWRKPNTDL